MCRRAARALHATCQRAPKSPARPQPSALTHCPPMTLSTAALAELLGVIAPVLVASGIGFAWSRSGAPFDEPSVTRLVLNVGVPCLIFSSLVRLPVPMATLLEMAGMATAAMFLFALVGAVILRAARLPLHTYLGPLVFTNSGNVGLPILLFAFGDAGKALGMAYFTVSSTYHVVLGGPLFAGRLSLRPLLASPLTWTVVVTAAVVVTGAPVPEWVMRSTSMLGDLAIPLMLLTLGVSLSKMRVRSLGRSVWLSALRIAMGAVVGLGVAAAFGATGLSRKVVVLQAAMPVGVLNYLFAQRYARSPEQVASLVLVSTLMSVLTIPVLLVFLG